MALLSSCYCCDLLIASVLLGIYALVAYAIAFTIELWWLLEAEDVLPPPAYLLCIGYFLLFLQTALLLHGLSVKRSVFLSGWLFAQLIAVFPEAGLVLFMSLHHWTLTHLYGLTEITCWLCRLLINVTCALIVHSLHAQWKEEMDVMRSLHALNMTNAVPQRMPIVAEQALTGFTNRSYSKSLNGSLRRVHVAPLNNVIPCEPMFSEFNASAFNVQQSQLSVHNNLRACSLLDLRGIDPSFDASLGATANYTHSLDRRRVKKCVKSVSVTDVTGWHEWNSQRLVARRSLGSGELLYRDVAL